MDSVLETDIKGIPFRRTIKLYLKRAKEIELYLSKRPQEWGKFQAEFNSEVDGVFRNIVNFEKSNLNVNKEDKVYKLKRLFVNRLRKIFVRGACTDWSLRKPFGYAGDFKIIDDIYQNNPTTVGFDRLFDNYFQMSAISVAVRNRKDDFKRIVVNFIHNNPDRKIRIMDLASGPCRELKEIFSLDSHLCKNVIFDCYDNEEKAIEYAKGLLIGYSNVNFIRQNAVRIALKKDIHDMIKEKYDLIYSTGLFDYFIDKVAVAVVGNLRKLLKPNGILAISNVRDKYSNPSVHFMEWVGDWNLIYRDDDAFKRIFIEAGFKENELAFHYEQQGIMQYIIASYKK